jgi:hypothetical protein
MRRGIPWLPLKNTRMWDSLRATENRRYRAATIKERSGSCLAARSAACALLLTALLAPALQAGDFDTLVARFSHESGATRTHIPFFWVARAVVAVAHPAGASELNLAVFEHANFEPRRFRELADDAVGGVWKPLIRVCSRNGESTNIYSRPAGRNLHLLLATLDHGEATFVELLVEPEALMTFIDEHGGRQHASDQ